MSNTKDLTPADIADIFGTTGGNQRMAAAPAFGGQVDIVADILTPTAVEPTEIPDKPVDEPTEQPTETPTEKPVDADVKQDADIFDEKDVKSTDKPLEIKGLTDYYQDRLKNGTFVTIESEDENGKKIPFIPQTPEEFDEVIEIQVNYKLEQAKKDLQTKWYEGKSPAWQAISQYAEIVDDPAQLIPFLQGVKAIQTVSELDEADPEQAEQIVRSRMEQRGDPDTIIKTQIESLKASDQLLLTAKQVKPIMVQQEQQLLSQQINEAKRREQEYLQVINDIRENAHKAIEQPLFGKMRLKQEEKALIYDLIAVPSEETQGYGIYSVIDKLFDTKDFETLKMIALLAAKKDAFFSYVGTDIANQTHAKLQKKLTVAGEMRTGGKDMDISDKNVVQRNQFTKTPRFGK